MNESCEASRSQRGKKTVNEEVTERKEAASSRVDGSTCYDDTGEKVDEERDKQEARKDETRQHGEEEEEEEDAEEKSVHSSSRRGDEREEETIVDETADHECRRITIHWMGNSNKRKSASEMKTSTMKKEKENKKERAYEWPLNSKATSASRTREMKDLLSMKAIYYQLYPHTGHSNSGCESQDDHPAGGEEWHEMSQSPFSKNNTSNTSSSSNSTPRSRVHFTLIERNKHATDANESHKRRNTDSSSLVGGSWSGHRRLGVLRRRTLWKSSYSGSPVSQDARSSESVEKRHEEAKNKPKGETTNKDTQTHI